MSVIAVRKYEDKIVISSDRQTSWGYQKYVDAKDAMTAEPSKMWQHNDLVVGGAGKVSESMLFRIFTKTRKPRESSVEAVLDFLVEFRDWAKKSETDFKNFNHFIIIFEGKVFQALGLEVCEVKEYNATGSGMFLALGAMYKGAAPQEAVDVAKEFDLFCSGETDTIEVPIKSIKK